MPTSAPAGPCGSIGRWLIFLIERKWITEQDRSDVERKLERKLKKNQGDVCATLGAVADIEAREVLQVIKNPQVLQSLRALPPARGHVLVETLVPPPAQRDSLRYTITRLHAEGGLGKIWVAHDTDLNRDVALKEIKSSTNPSPESSRRFLKEAQITGQLEHPNIVPVYELARRKEDDQPFYTMRFVRGQTFRDAIAEFHRRRAGKPPIDSSCNGNCSNHSSRSVRRSAMRIRGASSTAISSPKTWCWGATAR